MSRSLSRSGGRALRGVVGESVRSRSEVRDRFGVLDARRSGVEGARVASRRFGHVLVERVALLVIVQVEALASAAWLARDAEGIRARGHMEVWRLTRGQTPPLASRARRSGEDGRVQFRRSRGRVSMREVNPRGEGADRRSLCERRRKGGERPTGVWVMVGRPAWLVGPRSEDTRSGSLKGGRTFSTDDGVEALRTREREREQPGISDQRFGAHRWGVLCGTDGECAPVAAWSGRRSCKYAPCASTRPRARARATWPRAARARARHTRPLSPPLRPRV